MNLPPPGMSVRDERFMTLTPTGQQPVHELVISDAFCWAFSLSPGLFIGLHIPTSKESFITRLGLVPPSPSPPPKGGRGCLISLSCLESQGCHLILLSYFLPCFFSLVLLLFLSYHFSANVHSPDFSFPENFQIYFVNG